MIVLQELAFQWLKGGGGVIDPNFDLVPRHFCHRISAFTFNLFFFRPLMELPHLGTNCSYASCRRLDFLPVKCEGCHKLFCKDHYPYDNHTCTNPGIRDKQVPVCPLCNAIVPIRPGELPDVRVGHHIDTACQSKPALEMKGKIFSNACSFPRCKKRELVACRCDQCGLNFCMGHRNELDHQCKGVQRNNVGSQSRLSAAGAAAIFRAVFQNQSRNSSSVSPVYCPCSPLLLLHMYGRPCSVFLSLFLEAIRSYDLRITGSLDRLTISEKAI
ncbi:unnamed protein product [Echinostoma caproni]|uniref:AN1-type domain-containing protein n=1 Tax=Echinostoma caproni TaxID=27848 RepID=A0A183B6F4_9TREM|nr:unnamed protein product [Echinostoma caproni]